MKYNKQIIDSLLRHRAPALLLCISVVSPAMADDNSLSRLAELVESAKYEKALQLASSMLYEYEGDSRFDFLYAVSAINAGQLSEGIFALERLLREKPGDISARMELGRAYLLLGDDSRAQQEFAQVLKLEPSESERGDAQQQLSNIKIRQNRLQSGGQAWLQAGLGYDSNITSGPSESSFLPWIVTSFSLEDADGFSNFGAGGNYQHPVGQSSLFKIGGHVKHRAYEDGKLDSSEVYLRADLEYAIDSTTWDFFIKGQEYQVDSDTNRQLLAGGLEWHNRLNATTEIDAFFQYTEQEYPDQTLRDSALSSAGVGFRHVFAGSLSPRLFGSIYIGEERADDRGDTAMSIADRDITGLRAGIQLAYSAHTQLYGVLTAEHSEYGASYPFYTEIRDDDYFALQLGGIWNLDRNWSLQAEIRRSENDSNLGMMAFERTEASVQVRYDFR
ncbi:MAG: tetratricopeptide repeat protein [Sedimenticola sp.]